MQELGMDIFEAAKAGDLTRVRELIAADPTIVNLRDDTQKTPLHIAAENGHLDIVQIFICGGVDLNAVDENKNTPLHLAAAGGHSSIVQQLVNAGASVYVQNKEGVDPLVVAVANGYKDIVQALLDAHALDNVQDPCTHPLEMRCLRALLAAVYFKMRCAQALVVAVCNGRSEILLLLLTKVTDIKALDKIIAEKDDDPDYSDAFDNEGLTLIHFATYCGHKEIVQTLINAYVDLEAQDMRKQTALHYAAQHGNSEIAQILINGGANVNAIDNNNMTPLHFAIISGNKDLVQILMNAGANVNAQDEMKRTPMHLAVSYNRVGSPYACTSWC